MPTLESFFAFFNGLVAGCSQVLVMQPFEIIKVRLQTQTSTNKLYDGIFDCLKKIIKNQGFFALYKGSLTPFIGVGFLGSLRFGLYENGKSFIAKSKGFQNNSSLSRLDKSLSALYSALIVSFFLSPIQHTRIRVQIQRNEAEKVYKGSIDAAKKIFKQYGLKGLNRGQTASILREASGLVLYFSTLENLTDYLTPPEYTDKKNLPLYIPFTAGGFAGISYWVFTYPIDYVKTAMQTDKLGNFKYQTTLDCFKQKYQEHGMRGFYKGYVICLMRSFPVNAASIIVYRFMQKTTGVKY